MRRRSMWEPTTSPASQSLVLMAWRSRAGCLRLILLLSIVGLESRLVGLVLTLGQTNQSATWDWSQTGGVGQGGATLRPAQVREQFYSNSSSISRYRMKFIMYLCKRYFEHQPPQPPLLEIDFCHFRHEEELVRQVATIEEYIER